jgi:hypothetical protein
VTRYLRLLALLLLTIGLAVPGIPFEAAQKKSVYVKEYTKKDATTVKAHDRKAPEKRATAPKVPKAKKAAPVKASRRRPARVR